MKDKDNFRSIAPQLWARDWLDRVALAARTIERERLMQAIRAERAMALGCISAERITCQPADGTHAVDAMIDGDTEARSIISAAEAEIREARDILDAMRILGEAEYADVLECRYVLLMSVRSIARELRHSIMTIGILHDRAVAWLDARSMTELREEVSM